MLLHLKDAGFQVISILTTTGFATRDINGIYFTALAKQLFLIFMVIGACSGSTGGGIKIIRVVTLLKIIKTKILKVNSSFKSRVPLTIDKHIVENDEIYRIVTIVTFWMILLISGGAVTAFFSNHTAFESFSGMFSAVGNIGPCYISVKEMIALHPAVKLTYIFGMLAGRLEIIPVILIFNKKFFK
jgi:trk system potassium uptake protein TrkH